MWGLAMDQVISADIVLADGSMVTASETNNTDLFWVSAHVFRAIDLILAGNSWII